MLRLCAILLSLLPASLPIGGLDVVRPEPRVFGSTVAGIEQRLASLCASLPVRVVAPLATTGQSPIDCDGFLHAGQPHQVRLVVLGHRFDVAWILFPAAEKAEFLPHFAARHGAPSLQLEFGRIYLAAGASVRNLPDAVRGEVP